MIPTWLMIGSMALAACLVWPVASQAEAWPAAGEIRFPDDRRAVIDVRRDCGAVGDGVADDTDALQRAFSTTTDESYSRFVYLPNGTYRVTRPLVWRPANLTEKTGSMSGPWVYGQSRDGVTIKLADNAEGFSDPAVPRELIRGHWRPDGSKMNADFFDRTLVNLTLDTGDNRGAIGLRFYSNNVGVVRDVRLIGNGPIGLDLGWSDQNGPLLIQRVRIEGFAVGVSTRGIINSQTLSEIHISRAAEAAVRHEGQVFTIERLTTEQTPLAVDSRGGMLTLVDCDLRGGAEGASAGPAVRLRDGHLYASRVKTHGFARAIETSGVPGQSVDAVDVDEYTSHPVVRPRDTDPARGLQLRPGLTPAWAWESDPAKWVCANDHGVIAADEGDDSDALQSAIDHAAKIGATTVYLLGGKGGDPNWYILRKTVRVHGSVRHVTGFGFVRLLGGNHKDPGFPNHYGGFTVDDPNADAPPVVFTHLNVHTPWQTFAIRNAGRRTVVVEGCTPSIFGATGSVTFANNVVGGLFLEKGATMTVRHFNTEARDDQPRNVTTNDGGTLWVLSMKTEMATSKLITRAGGRTEILGAHVYSNQAIEDDRPCFVVEDASLSLASIREVTFRQKPYKVVLIDRRTGQDDAVLRTGTFPFALLRVESSPPEAGQP